MLRINVRGRETLGVVGGKKGKNEVRILKNECSELFGDNGTEGKTVRKMALGAKMMPLTHKATKRPAAEFATPTQPIESRLNSSTEQVIGRSALRSLVQKLECKLHKPKSASNQQFEQSPDLLSARGKRMRRQF